MHGPHWAPNPLQTSPTLSHRPTPLYAHTTPPPPPHPRPGFYCTDRTGRPVYIQQPGKVNTDELWKFTNLERCVRYHIQVGGFVCMGVGGCGCMLVWGLGVGSR